MDILYSTVPREQEMSCGRTRDGSDRRTRSEIAGRRAEAAMIPTTPCLRQPLSTWASSNDSPHARSREPGRSMGPACAGCVERKDGGGLGPKLGAQGYEREIGGWIDIRVIYSDRQPLRTSKKPLPWALVRDVLSARLNIVTMQRSK